VEIQKGWVSMQRDEFFKKELIEELRVVENLIRSEPSLKKRIYYFSAAYGITSRTFKYSFSKDVLLADFVLSGAYSLLQKKLEQLGAEESPPLQEKVDGLCDGLKLLADCIESDKSVLEALENIITIAYSTTGNGEYLEKRGQLKM
jgi:hypothetical protein